MQNSKEYLVNHQVRPFISFKDGKSHTVRLLKDKIDTLKDNQGNVKEGVKYLVMEGDTEKTFFTGSIALISKLAEYNEGDEVTIELKSRKAEGGEWRSYFEVSQKGFVAKIDEEIPVIEDEEQPNFSEDARPQPNF